MQKKHNTQETQTRSKNILSQLEIEPASLTKQEEH